jgi:hypothetical protein
MRLPAALLMLAAMLPAAAEEAAPATQVVTIPYMEREAQHRVYADELLTIALELSRDRYGPYCVVQQREETVIRRQLLQLGQGGGLSVAVAMPTQEWLDGALLKNKRLTIFRVPNTNIDRRFFERDKPYLLDAIVALEKAAQTAR